MNMLVYLDRGRLSHLIAVALIERRLDKCLPDVGKRSFSWQQSNESTRGIALTSDKAICGPGHCVGVISSNGVNGARGDERSPGYGIQVGA